MEALILSAIGIGFLHSLAPDHWLPFASIAKAQGWSRKKLLVVSFLAGAAHVGSSIVLGALGIFLGLGLVNLEGAESFRGNIAGFLLIGFGVAYTIWGLKHLRHNHLHLDATKNVTVWALIAIVAVVLVGLAVEGLAGAVERLATWTSFNSHQLRPRFTKLFGETKESDWRLAQRWIWKSAEASNEFARRRLRLLAARNTTFVLFTATLSIATGLIVERPAAWVQTLLIILNAGTLGWALFAWVWIAAQQGYTRAIQDAGRAGEP